MPGSLDKVISERLYESKTPDPQGYTSMGLISGAQWSPFGPFESVEQKFLAL